MGHSLGCGWQGGSSSTCRQNSLGTRQSLLTSFCRESAKSCRRVLGVFTYTRRRERSPRRLLEVGEFYLAGPTVFPGYLGADGRIGEDAESRAAFVLREGRAYYRSRDRLRRAPNGGVAWVVRECPGSSLSTRCGPTSDKFGQSLARNLRISSRS